MKSLLSKPWFWFSGVIVIALLAVGWILTPPETPEQPPSIAAPQADSRVPEPTPETARAVNAQVAKTELDALAKPGPLPPSLAGAEPDVTLQTDADGNLIVTPDIKTLFEFYLAALAEEPLETVLARIQYALAEQLEGQALAQARDLLRRFVDYKIQLTDLESSTGPANPDGEFSLAVLRERQSSLKSLRSNLFSETENTAFFKLDEVQDDYVLQRLAVQQNDNLTEQQRRQAIANLEQQLPEPVREVRKRVTRHGDLYARVEAMRASGASEEAIFRARAEELGPGAAERLAAVDREKAEWRGRLDDYARERDRIRASGLSPADQQAAIDRLIETRFDDREQMRVRALDPSL